MTQADADLPSPMSQGQAERVLREDSARHCLQGDAVAHDGAGVGRAALVPFSGQAEWVPREECGRHLLQGKAVAHGRPGVGRPAVPGHRLARQVAQRALLPQMPQYRAVQLHALQPCQAERKLRCMLRVCVQERFRARLAKLHIFKFCSSVKP